MKKLAILPNHPRARRWSAALIASAIALGACLLSYDNVEGRYVKTVSNGSTPE